MADEFRRRISANSVRCVPGVPRSGEDVLRRSLAAVRHMYAILAARKFILIVRVG